MICKCCKSNKNKAFFSKSQLKKSKNNRKCSDCCEKETSNFTLEKQQVLFSNLITWLRENGAEFPLLKIRHHNENFRGIVTTKNIYKGKVILKVPHSCIMTSIKAYKTKVGQELKNSGWEPHSSHTWLALFLLQEKLDPDSFWKPFLDILPPTYGDFPQFYSTNELGQLKGSFILDMIKSRNLNLEKEFNELIKAIPVFGKKISLRDYIWARIAVVSRVFQINFSEEEKTQGLVPMADMLNHAKTPGTKWSFVPDEDSFIIASDGFLFKDKEVFDTYGPKCNSRYLVNYGFTLKENQENNQAAIFLNPAKILDELKSPLKESKLRLLGDNQTTIDDSYCEYRFLIKEGKETRVSKNKDFRFQFMTLLDKEVSTPSGTFTGLHSAWCLFGFLRILLSSEEEFIRITNEVHEKMGYNKQVDFTTILLEVEPQSAETEVLILKVIADHCEKVLDGLPSLVEEDIKELETVEPYSNRWNILNMLIGEKKVLLFYRELGVFVNKMWKESGSVHKVGRFLRKHKLFSTYHKVYWSRLI